MKKIFFLLLAITAIGHSQSLLETPWMTDLLLEKEAEELTFQEIKEAGDAYWSTHDKDAKGSGFKPYMRWLETAKAFVKKDGTLQTNADISRELAKFQQKSTFSDTSSWLPLGPFTYSNTSSWSPGQGRVNSMTVDPNNPNTYYIGTPGGGAWKSVDAGVNWTPLNDFVSRVGASAVAVDPNNSNIVYVGTGDDDAGDSPSIGLLKSTDGGATFSATGLTFNSLLNANISEVYIDPVNSNKVVVSSNRGLYISLNAGTSFTRTFFGNVKDVKFKPGDSNTLYLSTNDSFAISTNGGSSWSENATGLPFNMGRSVIGVTPANSSMVYLLIIDSSSNLLGVYRSTNSGASFTKRDNQNVNILESAQGWYDLALEVSPTNPNLIYTGCLNMWRSSNGGASFVKLNSWNQSNDPAYVHADIHQIRQFGTELFALTDGGVYRSTNIGASFTDLTASAQIGQFYRVAVGSSSADLAGGLQDNGGFVRSNGTWKNFYGADGMEAGISPNDSNTRYGFVQFGGSLHITTNGITRAGSISGPEQGNWITPLKTDSQGTIYAGYSRLYKVNENSNFEVVSSSFGSNIDVIEIDPNDDATIYVAVNDDLFRSTNSGVSFNIVRSFSDNITAIEVNGNNSNTIYVATSSSFGSVFESTNAGASFTNITYNLPRMGKNTLAHQPLNAVDNLYVGTSAGVYRREGSSNQWETFNNSLPNTSIRDLEINTSDGIITAATYGRGIWQSALPISTPSDDIGLTSINAGNNGSISCSSGAVEIEVINNGLNTLTSIDVTYQINNLPVVNNQIAVNIAPNSSQLINIPNVSFPLGISDFVVDVTTANDAFASNNSREVSVSINQSSAVNDTYSFANREFLIEEANDGVTNTWERGVPSGSLLNQAGSGTDNIAYATNLNGDHGDDVLSFLYSGCYDLSTVSSPVLSFEMAYELENNWDLLYMEYSIDQGASWNVLGAATDPNWYNSSRSPNGQNCFNCVGAQWTGTNTTMTTYSKSLDFLGNQSSVIFRFTFESDQSVVSEGAVIDNFVITGTLSADSVALEDQFTVYPNPSTGIFNIQGVSGNSYGYQVYDISGKLILTQKNQDTVNQIINLNDVSQGVYLLKLSTKEGTLTKKLIKR